MTITDYRNFDLLITRAGERYRAFVVDAPAGEDSVVFDLPFAPDAMPRLGGSGLVRGVSRHIGAADDTGSAASLTDVGTRLFEAVFQDKVQTLLAASLSSVAQEGAGLRLRLRFEKDAAGLATLPWETLYDPTQSHFVGLGEQSPILRYLSLPRSRSALLVEPPLRVLAVLSSPADLPPLNMEREWQAIQDALAGLKADGKFVLERLATPTLVALQDRLLGEPVHILHFVGHGVFDEASQAGSLALEDARGRPHLVRGEQLAALLRNHPAMRLAYLNACEGALASGQSVFTGVAQTLVREGMPAAVAMQAEITDAGAIELARTFYTALAAGRPVDAALTQARVALSVAGSPEWAIPVLFSRSPDNRLFDIRQVLPTPDCPYPGMTPFSEAQRDLFFGRDKEIEDAVERLRQHPFLMVVGPSGSGKSSLIYAGVIPALRRSKRFGPGAWDIKIMRPGDSRTADGKAAPMQALAQLLNLSPQSPVPNPQSPTLLFVDQFEETFTLAGADEAQAFLDALNGLMGRPNLHILLTVRADFYPELMASSLWQPIRANRLELTPLGDDELWAAIVEPAARVGVEVDEALAVKLIADASGQKGVLPLVQETLVLLWDKVKSRRLKLETYKEMGEDGRSGLQVAIDRRATTVYHNLPDAAQPIARRIFLRLIQFGEGRADTRRQQTAAELRASGDDPALFDQTLARLTESRLLTASGDAEGGERRVDIAHEALIAGWPRLQAWLDQRRSAEQTRRRLEAKADEWVAAEKRGRWLDEYELQEAENWLAGEDGRELGYSPDLVDLVQASMDVIAQAVAEKVAQQQREMEQTQRLAEERRLRAEENEKATRSRRKRLIAATGAVIIAAIAFAAAAWFGVDASRQSDNAKAKGIEAEKVARSAQAEGLVGLTRLELAQPIPDYSLALMLAQEAVSSTWITDGYVFPNAEAALSDAIAAAPPWRMNLPPRRHDGPVTSVAFSFDGQTILTTSSDGTARIWDVATGQEQQRLMDPAEEISFAAFSPDGQQIVTDGRNGSIRLWDAAAGQVVRQLGSHDCSISFGTDGCAVRSVAYSPNGKSIISGGDDGTARIWDVATGKEILRLTGHGCTEYGNCSVNSVVYSSDGKTIVTAAEAGTAHIWDATTGQQVRQIIGHTSDIRSAAYSPDGKQIITASGDGTARIWDAATGQEVHQLLPVTDLARYVSTAAYSPDGRFIITVTELDGTARVWDAATKQEIRQLHSFGCDEAGNCGVMSAAYSPDSQYIVTGNVDGTMHIWDATTSQEVRQIGGHGCISSSCSANSAAYSPGGKQIVTTGNDGTARIWDAATGQEVRQLRGHTGHVGSASYSPDGRQIVTTGCDKIEDGSCKASSARIWDADTGQERRQLIGHDCSDVFYGCFIFSAAYSPDGKQIVTAGADQTTRIWNAVTGQEVRQLRGHAGSVRSATFSPDGLQIITAGDDGVTRIWDAATGNELRQLAGQGCGDLDVPPPPSQSRSEPPPGCGINSAAYNPDGKQIVTADYEGMARIWDAVTGQEVRQLRGHSGYVQTATFSPDGQQIITTGDDGTARIWDATTGAQLRLLTEGTGRILSAAFSPDGNQIITTGSERTARIWDVTPKPDVHEFGDSRQGFSSAVYSPDGQFIMTTVSFGNTVDIWNAVSGKLMLTLPRHGCAEHNYCRVYAARYSPDGKQIVTAAADHMAYIWDAVTGQEIRQLTGHTAWVPGAVFSPDGKLIVTASGDNDNTARIWDASSGQEVHRLIGHTDTVNSAAFSPNGKTVVTASYDETARIWDVATGQPVHQLDGHRSWVRSAAYSPDGKFVVTASSDGTVRIWDAATGQEIRQIVSDLCKKNSLSCMIGAAIYSPDNRYIVIAEGAIAKSTGGVEERTIRFFDAATGKEVRSLKGHGGSDGSIAFSPDGEHIVTASGYGTARIWDANIEDLLDKAQRLISRDPPLLTPDELRSYGLVEEVR